MAGDEFDLRPVADEFLIHHQIEQTPAMRKKLNLIYETPRFMQEHAFHFNQSTNKESTISDEE